MRIPRLIRMLALCCVALPGIACTCGGYASFTEIFATPGPQSRRHQALIVRNLAVNGRGVQVEVIDRLTPGEVENKIVIFGGGFGCTGPVKRKSGEVWIAAISRRESRLLADLPAYDLASCAESSLSYDPESALATGNSHRGRGTGKISLYNLRQKLDWDFRWDYTHIECESYIIDMHNRVYYGRKKPVSASMTKIH